VARGATLGATAPGSGTEQHSAHRLRGGPLVSLDQVPVHVLGDRDAGVPEDIGRDMQRRALGKHRRGARMPQLVRVPMTQPRGLA